ncbi:UDP-N-acetyl-D-mannosamine dehydrogenase [Pseudoalteromonas piscicida]|uniref:UDP-N-acetyl-D-mannosamine dehydrogenase n=1 Tax=Pseudoalteromonas piscicida TaxID=43662 RepID=A0AAD0RGE6_PSEO7|nr:UDP-N-acetyl-D-mannosamine dehydrogenase [Pseudoalteromonas piscicida]ASD68108.1 UDP-N-acetyl-D-mannosamine dehydrogenase [Pseudoalteromonas piscicida]AXR01183.1 UDP-N-acetyl-D-mannosamine dehydrogenase [Pseudoalteromonas piscicida]
MSFNTISVVGLGYIGLPTAAMFASRKKKVIGVDVNQHAVDTINRGEIHIIEPELDMIVHAAVTEGYLKATTKPEPADAFLIAVPTPFKNNGSEIPEPDLTYIKSAADAIAPVLKKGDLVILESTSPVGATEKVAEWLAEARADLSFPQDCGEDSDIRIAHCPERVLPGHVVRELVENDRVIGGMTAKCSQASIDLYKIFVNGECVVTNARTAEMAKLTENSCRDVQIAFANELSVLCDQLDIDVWELISLANRHPRINILQPGPGVGGHCIAVDPWFIVSKTPELSKIIHTARLVNDAKPQWVIDKVKGELFKILQNSPNTSMESITVACYGLSFKPDIDDLRESPALTVAGEIRRLHKGEVLVVEPNINQLPSSLTDCKLTSLESAAKDADLHVILVNHKEFSKVAFENCNHVLDTVGALR